jgi:hypothetical protein
VWAAWSQVPEEARQRYLDRTVRRGDVTVNGRLAAAWPAWRQLLKLRPVVRP